MKRPTGGVPRRCAEDEPAPRSRSERPQASRRAISRASTRSASQASNIKVIEQCPITTNASEVVIIGGGIYGTSLAYQLAKAGKTVTLLEAGEIACGASGGPGERGVRANGRDYARAADLRPLAGALGAFTRRNSRAGSAIRSIGGIKVYDISYGHREHEVVGRMEATAAAQTSLGAPSEVLDARTDAGARA